MSAQPQVRVRFAPSPTGHLHIGSFRAALFNYLFARHHNGVYLLRIEDTDLERSKQVYVDSIERSLAWAQLNPDEPVLVQSSRVQEHKALIQKLLDEGKAYRCYCTQEQVVARYQKAHNTDDMFIKYDGACKKRDYDATQPCVVRFALPDVAAVTFDDLIRGSVTVERDQLDDFIIARSDGSPTYNFVVVADDAHMRITHVIRGDDHIANTPKQILLYQALGYALPAFAHIPLILGKEGNKLSKRDAATAVVDYIAAGYLPDAFTNYLARLGWSHGDQEIFSREELIQYFTLDHVGKKGAIFDPEKLDWVNGVYMRAMSADALCDYMRDTNIIDCKASFPLWNDTTIQHLIDLYKERCNTLRDLADTLTAVYHPPQAFDEHALAQWVTQESIVQLVDLIKMLEGLQSFTVDLVKDAVKDFCKTRGIKMVTIAQPIRIALVGTTSSPGIMDMLALIGQQESIHRIKKLVEHAQR